jgi:hypothetical protein
MSEEKIFGKYNEIIMLLIGFVLTGLVGTYITQAYTTKNSELVASNKVFSEYSKLAGDRYFTMNQVFIALREKLPKDKLKSRLQEYRKEVKRWNTARNYNREMIKLYFGYTLYNSERDIHYSLRTWGKYLEAEINEQGSIKFICVEEARDKILRNLRTFYFSLGEAIQLGNIGSSRATGIAVKNSHTEGLCLTSKLTRT